MNIARQVLGRHIYWTVKIFELLIRILEEKQKHYSGPLSASDWIDILKEATEKLNEIFEKEKLDTVL